MANQAAAATISYTAAILDPSLAPVYDDSLTRNNVTVTNAWTGYSQQAILTAGAMSVRNPPSGIGNGYAYTMFRSAAADSQIAGIANWLLNVGLSMRSGSPYSSLSSWPRRPPRRCSPPSPVAAGGLPADHEPPVVPDRFDHQAAGVGVLRDPRRQHLDPRLQHGPRIPLGDRVQPGDGADRADPRVGGHPPPPPAPGGASAGCS